MSAYGHTADDSFDPRPFAPQLFQLATDSNDHYSLKAELGQVKDKPTARDLVSLFDNDWITSRGMVTRISDRRFGKQRGNFELDPYIHHYYYCTSRSMINYM